MHNHGSVGVRHWLMKFGIAFFSAGLALILVEVAFGLILYRDDLKIFRAFKNIGQVDELRYSNKEVTLREMIRKSDNSRIIYELIPGISFFL
jgi:hypothetical protein